MNSRFPRPSNRHWQKKSNPNSHLASPKKDSYENKSNPKNHHLSSPKIHNNRRFNIEKLILLIAPHRSRLVLTFPDFSNKIFYEHLNKENKENVNKLLFQLWDKYQPKRIDTNCGERSRDGFHCKLIFDDTTFLQILNSNNVMLDNVSIDKHIKHYNQHKQNYICKYQIIQVQQFENDLKIYNKEFQANENEWYPKINPSNASKSMLNEGICQNILFDINDTKQTVLYLEFDTKEKYNEFKMINYEKVINEMIQDILKGVKCLINCTKELNKNKKFIPSLFEWFKLNFRAYASESTAIDDEKQSEMKSTIIVRVEAYVSILNYVYFVFIFKKQWLRNRKNKKSLNNWFRLYCNHIYDVYNVNHASKYTKNKLKKTFDCKFTAPQQDFHHNAETQINYHI